MNNIPCDVRIVNDDEEILCELHCQFECYRDLMTLLHQIFISGYNAEIRLADGVADDG